MSLACEAANLRAPTGFISPEYYGSLTTELSHHQQPAPSDLPVLVILDPTLASDTQTAFLKYLEQHIPADRSPSPDFAHEIKSSRRPRPKVGHWEVLVNSFFVTAALRLIEEGARDFDQALGLHRVAPVIVYPQLRTPEASESGERPTLRTVTDWALVEARGGSYGTVAISRIHHLLELLLPAASNVGGELDDLIDSLAAGYARLEDLTSKHQILLVKLFSAAINANCTSISWFDGKSYLFGRIVADKRYPGRFNLLLTPKTPFSLSTEYPPFFTLMLSTLYPVYSDSSTAYIQRVANLVSSVSGLAEALAPNAPAPSSFVRLNIPAAVDASPSSLSTFPSATSSSTARSSTLPSSLSTSVIPSTSTAYISSPPSTTRCRPSILRLEGLAGSGITGDAYWSKLGSAASVVTKLSRKGYGAGLVRELKLLDKVRKAGVGVDVYGVFGRGNGEDAEYAVVMEDGGVAAGNWMMLCVAERQSLILYLLRLHLVARIQHGDPRPPNAVVKSADPSQPATTPRRVKWIDIIGKTGEKIHSACRGLKCKEVEDVIRWMGLTVDEVEEVRLMAVRERLLDEVTV
ncbi:hypothetical protein JCM11251_005805 [Rhodosporidiobolus azoricus]